MFVGGSESDANGQSLPASLLWLFHNFITFALTSISEVFISGNERAPSGTEREIC